MNLVLQNSYCFYFLSLIFLSSKLKKLSFWANRRLSTVQLCLGIREMHRDEMIEAGTPVILLNHKPFDSS